MNVLEAIRTRCSVRQFKPEVIPDDILRKILEAARWAPSPFNTQPWEFIIIKDKDTLKAISKYARYAGYLADAPMAIAVIVTPIGPKFSWTERLGEPKFAASKAVQNILLAAWELGVGACTVSIERDKVGEILGVPKTHFVLVVIPIGYPETMPQKHEDSFRKKLEDMVFYEKYGRRID